MAFGWVSKLTGLFGGASKNEAPTTIDITTSELFNILKPVLEDPQRKYGLISSDIDDAEQKVKTIIASSRCDYSPDINNFRDSLATITNLIPAMSPDDHIIAIPVATLQELMAAKTSLMSVTQGLEHQYSSPIETTAEILPFNEQADHFEFFAAKEHLTDTEIDSMKNSILRLDDSLSEFARKHDIRSPTRPLPRNYEPPYYS